MNKLVYLVPVLNPEIFDNWFAKSEIEEEILKIPIPSNSSVSQEFNKILENIPEDKWLVFCEQDVRFLENIVQKLEDKDQSVVYGVMGARRTDDGKREIIDGRGGNSALEGKLVDSLTQGCIIVHSSLLKKLHFTFDASLDFQYMLDFSLYCKKRGIPQKIIPIRIMKRETVVPISKIEEYKKILRQKYIEILPIELWGSTLSTNEIVDLLSYVEERDKWISILLQEKKILFTQLRDKEKLFDDIMNESPKDTNLKIDKSNMMKKMYEQLEEKIVWIFGTPRSGSTWLGSEILRRERVKFLDESMLGAHLGAFLDNPQVHWNFMINNYAANFTRIIDTDRDNLFFSSKFESTWKESLRQMILSRISAQFGFTGFDNIVIKAPNESHASDIIMKCLPKSKLIFLIRDGRDVIDSRQGKYHNPRPGAKAPETPEEKKFRLAHFAKIWNWMISVTKHAYDHHDPKLRLLVRYEDLRKDPISWIRRIYNFLGWNISDAFIQKIAEETKFENVPPDQKGEDKNKRKATPGGYKDYFTEDEIRIVNRIMREYLLEFGYKL